VSALAVPLTNVSSDQALFVPGSVLGSGMQQSAKQRRVPPWAELVFQLGSLGRQRVSA